MRKIAHVPVQTWTGWNPNDLFGGWFCLGRIQDPDRGNDSSIRNMFNSAPALFPCYCSQATIERKTAASVMMLWK
jgi:hypothetical protein